MRSSLIIALVVAAACVSGAQAVTCGPCNATSCAESTCGPNTPYFCNAGYGYGGCAAHPDAWKDTKVCFQCCDVNECAARFSCTGKCSQAVCEAKGRCPITSNYECTSGKFANGCSANASYWGFQHDCNSCCDITTCEYTCGTCTAAQCAAGSCTSKDRFQCTSGPMANQCSNSAPFWGEQSQCFGCCDTSTCAATFSCNQKCSVAVCHSVNRCPITSQYQCTAGSASLGCSKNASFWPFDHQCTDCCDVTQCEFTCPPCTLQQCSVNTCTPANPYVCLAGTLKNGCSAIPSYFGEQSQCFACCDSSACPSGSSSSSGGEEVRLH